MILAIAFFFFTTPSQKKTTTHYHRLLLFKHKEESNDNVTIFIATPLEKKVMAINCCRLPRCKSSTKKDRRGR
jgi:hypothetical protein